MVDPLTPDDAKSEGQRLLLSRAESHTEIAEALGCTKQAVSSWRRGAKRPGRERRDKMHELFGIEPGAWFELPGDSEPETTPEPVSHREHLLEMLAEVRKNRHSGKLIPSERRHSINTESRLIDQIRELDREEERARVEREMLEDRIVKEHPAWKQIRAAFREVLDAWPDAAEALAERLRELGM